MFLHRKVVYLIPFCKFKSMLLDFGQDLWLAILNIIFLCSCFSNSLLSYPTVILVVFHVLWVHVFREYCLCMSHFSQSLLKCTLLFNLYKVNCEIFFSYALEEFICYRIMHSFDIWRNLLYWMPSQCKAMREEETTAELGSIGTSSGYGNHFYNRSFAQELIYLP